MVQSQEVGGYKSGDEVRYCVNGKPGLKSRDLDGVGRIEVCQGGPTGYRICVILPKGKDNSDARVMRLENEIEYA
jgi:hypothetical protein